MIPRDEILERIRKAKGVTSATDAGSAYASITREYQQAASSDRTHATDLFEERLLEYDARVFRIDAAGLPEVVASILRERTATRVLVPDGLPAEWMSGAEFVVDQNFSIQQLDSFTSVMTACTLGIAETGTIVLQNAPGQGRRSVSLVPDYHLCVVKMSSIVETVVEAMRLLEPTRALPTTFFSGPSATADIEMTRIKGVHGPRFVDVVLLDDEF